MSEDMNKDNYYYFDMFWLNDIFILIIAITVMNFYEVQENFIKCYVIFKLCMTKLLSRFVHLLLFQIFYTKNFRNWKTLSNFFWKEDCNLIYWEMLCVKCAAWIVEQGLFFIFCSRILVNVIAGGTQASSSSEFN